MLIHKRLGVATLIACGIALVLLAIYNETPQCRLGTVEDNFTPCKTVVR